MDLTETIQTRCPGCDAPSQAGDLFCERCGARLPDRTESEGGADRSEVDHGLAAAISDRGRVHRRNEDAFSLFVEDDQRVAAIVCDGISSASAGDLAARNAAETAGARLAEALLDSAQDGPSAVSDAIHAAHAAVAQVPWTTRVERDAPSCTLVCALWRRGEIIVGSVGDSRAYWLTGREARQLTTDDSWAEAQVADGAMTPEQAMSDPRAHTITHWIGGDAPERPAEVTSFRPQQQGRLLLCSDGLWNYAAGPAELSALVDRLPREASCAAVARSLVDTALERGGRDNITVSIIDVRPTGETHDGTHG